MITGALLRRSVFIGLNFARRQQSYGSTCSPGPSRVDLLQSLGVAVAAAVSAGHLAHAASAESSLEFDKPAVDALRLRIKDILETSEEARWLDDGDFTLHRFLVSRGYNLDQAEAMFRGTVEWRTSFAVREQLKEWRAEGHPERELAQQYAYASRNGTSEDGVPLNIERVGQYDIAGCVRVPGMTDLVAKSYIMYLEETFNAVREASHAKGCEGPLAKLCCCRN